MLAAARYNFRRLLAWLRLLLLRILIALIHSFTCSWTFGGKPFEVAPPAFFTRAAQGTKLIASKEPAAFSIESASNNLRKTSPGK